MNNWQRIKKEPQLLDKFLIRSKVMAGLRLWMAQENITEVETPLMLAVATTEPYYDLFETKLKLFGEQKVSAFLSPSPELQMKKLLAAGLGDIYQISKCFRNNEGRSPTHQSEFVMLEYYRANANYEVLMDDLQKLLLFLLRYVKNDAKLNILTYQGKDYDLSSKCERLSVANAWEKYVGVKDESWLNIEGMRKIAVEKGYNISPDDTWEQMFDQILLNEIEPHLGIQRPTLLDRYPASQAALAQLCPDDSRFAQRFEWWLAGLELGNAYGELTDWQEQETRIKAELGATGGDYDHDFIEALKVIPRDCAGIAIGVDRLVMLLADVADIAEITFFPTTELF